ncbi:amidohydrolase [Microbacterium sp. ZXX196]|uniref:amidohydrolase n=1 Tax=Microbacterium sp. ZXX196 TaxID=2609291 RepID=UPI0012B9248A|nr:amidohydrolase family protein [Microbacterium sp. ZXX196]MTE23741.1 amidohydrolase family protein [Microbacterium sp. ZXX196]
MIGECIDVIANVRVAGEGRELLAHPEAERDGVFDVWLAAGAIADIAPAGALPRRGRILDAGGGWLVPGLWDHHTHFLQWSLATTRPSVQHAASPEEAARFAAGIAPGADGRRVLTHWRDGLWAAAPTRAVLDAATGDVPTYLLSSDVHSVWLNTAAFRRERLEPTHDGLVREAAAFALIDDLDDVAGSAADAAHDRAARAAAARGVVGIWDLEFGENHGPWRRRADAGWDALRVFSNVYPDDLEQVIAEGLATGDPLGANPLVRMGMLKVFGDGALGSRTAATTVDYDGHAGHRGALGTDPERMVELVARAATAGIATTIHAIGDAANAAALDAFARADLPGRIEHAQLLAAADVPRFSRLGVDASVQPQHLVDDRDLTDAYWSGQHATPYPLAALAAHGANLLFGSDAPVSPLDPWAQMAAAVFRTNDERAPWRPEQALDIRTALAASTAGGSADPQVILPGHAADLAVVSADPLRCQNAASLREMPVQATLLGGRVTHAV